MDVPDHAADLKEVDLREMRKKTPLKNDKEKRLTVDVDITFWTHVGWDGVLVMLFSLGITGLFVYIVYLYTKTFQAWHRPGMWVFMVFAFFYTLLPLIYLFSWKKIAKSYTKTQVGSRRSQSAEGIFFRLKNMWNMLSINGALFLWKLYLFELIESINQLVNFVTVYLWMFPVEVTVSICVGLSMDSLYRAYLLRQPNTIARRDHQIKIDIFLDFLCVTAPLCILWIVYQIPISIPELTQIVAWPAFCLLNKLRSLPSFFPCSTQ